jgi:Domain of unknown function (DUF4440)
MYSVPDWSVFMPRLAIVLVAVCFTLPAFSGAALKIRNLKTDKEEVIELEDQWLHARDAATLDRILASDFVHPVSVGYFLNKEQHIDWYTGHLPPLSRKTRFDQVQVRLYGNTAIVNGIVIASDESGKETDRSVFTDIFVYRENRWQAVNAQENRVER